MEYNKPIKKDVTIIIACYNELPHLASSVFEIEKVMRQTHYSYNLLFIDDCSQDNTREEIINLCKNKDNYKYIFHKPNVGRGGTVKEGLLLSQSKYAGFLDIDLEVHARYIPSMIAALEDGNDLVSVDRIYRLQFGVSMIIRGILSKINKWFVHKIFKIKSPDSEAGYKFFNLETMRPIIESTEDMKWFWDTEVIIRTEKADKKILFIPVVFLRREEKKSTVRVIPDSIKHLKALWHFRKLRI